MRHKKSLHFTYTTSLGEEIHWKCNDYTKFKKLQKKYNLPAAAPIHSCYIKKIEEDAYYYKMCIIINDVAMTLQCHKNDTVHLELSPYCHDSFYFYYRDHHDVLIPSSVNKKRKEPEYYYFVYGLLPFFKNITHISEHDHFEVHIPPHVLTLLADLYLEMKGVSLESIVRDIQQSRNDLQETMVFF